MHKSFAKNAASALDDDVATEFCCDFSSIAPLKIDSTISSLKRKLNSTAQKQL
jgi:hypothetical protein